MDLASPGVIPDRKYAAPPPLPGGHQAAKFAKNGSRQIGAGNKRTTDDLHEWSIYRQNLTSSIAGSLLGLAEHQQQLPFGDFQMHDQTVESVLQQGRREDVHLGDKGEIYLRFGLPRVVLDSDNQASPESDAGARSYRHGGGRKAASELDLRRTVLEAPNPRGPYAAQGKTHDILAKTAGKYRVVDNHPGSRANHRRFASVDDGLNELIDGPRDYYPPGPAPQSHHLVSEYARSDLGDTASVHGFGPSNGHNFSRDLFRPGQAHKARIGPAGLNREATFLEGKRHHGHYFSNLDLSTTTPATYNYLRYAKAEELNSNVTKFPHLVLRNVSFERDMRSSFDRAMLRTPKYVRMIDNISLELRGGETLALMYTSEDEIQTLMSLLTNMHNIRGRALGAFVVNGVAMKAKQVGDRIAYVCDHDLHPGLTVKQHLRMISRLILPATNAFRKDSMITQLIQTLALAPFHDRLVGELGRTEKQRVKVACQILLDTDVIVLDNITKDMDLYDAAFLIDYLRDWASKLNRIVIMAINPPTFELLTMFTKGGILASGRLIYCGVSHKMTEYFDTLNYPCPLFKNPCDYYVDLATSDYLTVEASLESSERIKRLGDIWLNRSPAIPETGLPGTLPPKLRRANVCSAVFWLYLRFWLFFLNDPLQVARQPLFNGLVSIGVGVIFLSLGDTQGSIGDRIGLFYSMLTLFLLPDLLLNIYQVSKDRRILFVDNKHRLYSKLAFVIAKVLFDFPLALVSYAFLAIPVYFLAELQPLARPEGHLIFLSYLGIVSVYCLAWRMASWCFAFAFPSLSHGAAFLGALLSLSALSAGVTLHTQDMWSPALWLRYGSPTQWAAQILVKHEFLGNGSFLIAPELNGQTSLIARPLSTELTFRCVPKTVSYGNIVTSLPCPIKTGADAMRFARISANQIEEQSVMLYFLGVPIILGFGLVFFLLNFCMVYCNHRPLHNLDSSKRRSKVD